MGEGEVCVAVVNDVGEMETESVTQKRDHQWLTGDSDTEPFAKKQAKVGSDDAEVEPCARIELEVALHSIEQKPCANKVPPEGLHDIELEHFVENHVKECSNESEWQSSSKKQSEAINNIGPEPSGEQPVKECSKEINEEHCDKNQEIHGLNDIGADVSVEQPVKEGLSEVELEHCEREHTPEALNDIELNPVVEQKEPLNEIEHQSCDKALTMEALNNTKPEPCVEQPIKEFPNEKEVEPCDEMQATKAGSDIELEPSIEQPVRERSNEMEVEVCGSKQTTEDSKDTVPEPYVQQSVKECMNEMSLEACGVMQTKQALNDEQEPLFEPPVNAFSNEREPEPCATNQTTEALNDIELELSVEQHIKHCSNELAVAKEVKEASNDDICSEVSNPNLSPHDNASSFQAISSQQVGELVIKDQVVCGDITSTCSVSSSSEGSSREEEHDTNDASGTMSTSHVVLEIPKHACTSGVRKITFKFSKRKEDYDSQLSASAAQPVSGSFDDGTHKLPRLTHLTGQGLHETTDSLIYPTNMEEMKSGKFIPDSYPTTVKRLLSTRILEGAKVKYISTAGELIGIVKDCGYLCGCATCNFSKILRAHEFEEHAGGKTRHPNNHIYLENGKPIYSIIQEMKTAPFSIVDEVIKEVAGSSVNEEFLQVWKASLQRNIDGAKIDNNYHTKLMNLYHSTTSCTSHTTEDCSSPDLYYRKSFSLEPQTYVKKTAKEHKRPPKKPRSYLSSTAVEPKRSAEGGHKKRDNDLHRLLFMPNGLPDGTDLAYYARGKKILGGYKQGNGIVCSHCDNEISPSQFEAHAGWAAKRQPYRHIYISDGLTLHDIALLLANGQSIATSNSDDMCAVCGDRGELVICNGCPRAFHAVCLGLEGVPNEDWQCPYCRDSLGSGKKAAAESRPIVIRLTRVVKGREYEAGGCVICRAHDFSVADFDDRTVMICDQCEKEYHVGCLRESGICDLKALPLEKWFCCNHCDIIHGSMQEVVSNGAAVLSASVLSTINKKHMEKGIFDVAPNQIRWRILSGKSRYPEHLPLLSRAAAIFRECFDPIVAKSGRDLIPVMVYGRNISGQEFGGIYCVVLMVGSVVVCAGLLRIFGREVAELPLVATSRQNQGKGYFQALFSCIEELLLSVGVENLVLPAAEEAESIWTKKLGFRKMSDERYSQYSRDIQLTIFKGTSMLEKELCRPTE